MTITTQDLVNHYGRDLIAGCDAVVETLAPDGDGWTMTRTYRYSDGSERVFKNPQANCSYFVLPATPGWQYVALPCEDDRDPTLDDVRRQPVVAWRWQRDDETTWLLPEMPGETTLWGNIALAVQGPDGRVIHSRGPMSYPEDPRLKSGFTERAFATVEAWAEDVIKYWSALRKEKEACNAARAADACPTCGHYRTDLDDDFPF